MQAIGIDFGNEEVLIGRWSVIDGFPRLEALSLPRQNSARIPLTVSRDGSSVLYGTQAQRLTGGQKATSFLNDIDPRIHANPLVVPYGTPAKCELAGCEGRRFVFPKGATYCCFCGRALVTASSHTKRATPASEAQEYFYQFLKGLTADLAHNPSESAIAVGLPPSWFYGDRSETFTDALDAILRGALGDSCKIVPYCDATITRYADVAGLSELPPSMMVIHVEDEVTYFIVGSPVHQGGAWSIANSRIHVEFLGTQTIVERLAQYASAALGIQPPSARRDEWLSKVRSWVNLFRENSSESNMPAISVGNFEPFSQRPLRLTGDIFQKECFDIIERFQGIATAQASRAAIDGISITQVLVSGRGASWFWIRPLLAKEFGESIVWIDDDPSWTVALGLASLASGNLATKQKAEQKKDAETPERLDTPMPQAPMAVWLMDRDSELEIRLFEDQIVGRKDLVSEEHPEKLTVSRKQARLLIGSDGKALIQNLGGKDIEIDGQLVSPDCRARVRTGTLIRIGKFHYVVQCRTATSPKQAK